MAIRRNSLGLGELEGLVLDRLWEDGELATPAVHEAVGRPRGLAYTTILTVLQRLHKKGLVVRREQGKSHTYAAALARAEFARRRGVELAGLVTELSTEGLAAFLTEAHRLDPQVLDAFRQQLGDAE